MQCPKCESNNLNYLPWLGQIWQCNNCGYRGAIVANDFIKDFQKLLEMISELNMEDEGNLVGMEELTEIIELAGKISKHYKYEGLAGMEGVNDGLRKYIDMRRFEEDKLTTYLSWWIKRRIEIVTGFDNPDEK